MMLISLTPCLFLVAYPVGKWRYSIKQYTNQASINRLQRSVTDVIYWKGTAIDIQIYLEHDA